MPEIKVKRGAAELVAITDNFYNITPPEMPKGWKTSFSFGNVSKVASIDVDYLGRTGSVNLDHKIFNDPDIPEGCKVFFIFHEIGHLIYGPDESKCDEFAFYHALRAGVTPFLCYVGIRAYMPEHYNYRIYAMFENLAKNINLKNDLENE